MKPWYHLVRQKKYFVIDKHLVAIVKFMHGITSISRQLLTTMLMTQYFVVHNVTLSVSIVPKLLDYQYKHKPESNDNR